MIFARVACATTSTRFQKAHLIPGHLVEPQQPKHSNIGAAEEERAQCQIVGEVPHGSFQAKPLIIVVSKTNDGEAVPTLNKRQYDCMLANTHIYEKANQSFVEGNRQLDSKPQRVVLPPSVKQSFSANTSITHKSNCIMYRFRVGGGGG